MLEIVCLMGLKEGIFVGILVGVVIKVVIDLVVELGVGKCVLVLVLDNGECYFLIVFYEFLE